MSLNGNPPDTGAAADSFGTEPATALQVIAAHAGPVMVDLDETLYLRNSTEDFLDCAWPGLFAVLLLRVLDVLKPWRRTGGEVTRDVWRVNLIRWLMPWTTAIWNRRVAQLAQAHTNRPLMGALKSRLELPIVVTVGFDFIVRPLVVAMGLSRDQIVACEPRFADRRRGKLAMAQQAFGDETVARSLLVTDSLQDLPLLQRCARGLHTIWPDARYRRALGRVYIPGQYLSQVKRPGERYITRGILQEDFAFWVFSSVTLAQMPVLHVLGLLFLLASFWAIYERGYVDNDIVGSLREKDAKLSAAFFEAPVATPRWQPWIWAGALGAIGITLTHWSEMPRPADFAWWAAALLATYGVFVVYNRLDKPTRIWVFPLLQFARSAVFVVVVPITEIGGAALAAHVIARWLPYYMYRLGGNKWPDSSIFPIRLLFFVIIAVTLAIAQGWHLLVGLSPLLLLFWNLVRARHELRRAVKQAGTLGAAR